ncbi:CRISPR-associated protein Cas1 [Stackebrandtia albiflava]|uniref:CRISPR-associated endonuclease Cas1 n=1 Tax=Stackebrandtia albiflava TaxID=406432 RepID=A0A562UR92_9ACTN|nr:type I-E CRISPR-associated endonuclease Cas1e [Stackebrandtia albiflava]TWJ08145.1 CRISPR-associated protein Cas1 [Stackebrandtia albiflava]
MTISAIPPPGATELTTMGNRITFLYRERCVIDRHQNGITLRDERGVEHLPGAGLGVLMLGPGTTISHSARRLLADNGATLVDVGEQGVRMYTHGRPLSSSTRLLQAQARAFASDRERLRVARDMYRMRFPDDDPTDYDMRTLRGKEGTRVKQCYRTHAERTGVAWTRREYDRTDFAGGTPINQALSAGTACLYGICHSVIVAMGMSPGLGFVHTGYYPAFVHDIADLYKADYSIPNAFDVVADGADDIPREARTRLRARFASGALMKRCVADLQRLLFPDGDVDEDGRDLTVTATLWDDRLGEVPGGVDYSADAERVWGPDE